MEVARVSATAAVGKIRSAHGAARGGRRVVSGRMLRGVGLAACLLFVRELV